MNMNLYELLDGLEPEELEAVSSEPEVELPKGVSMSGIRKKLRVPRLYRFRWQHAVAVAACACLLIAGGFWFGRLTNQETPSTIGTPTTSPLTDSGEEEPVEAIVLRNLEAYEQLYNMAQTEDEEALQQYLLSIEGGGADSREDIMDFLEVVERLPIPELIDGKVIYIQYRAEAEDATITLMARDGSWIRITYYLYADSNSLEDRYESGEFADSQLDAPIYSNDNTNSVYNETRAPYPVGSGSEIVWDMQIAGVTTQIYYYTNHAETVDTQSLMQNLKLTNLAMMMK